MNRLNELFGKANVKALNEGEGFTTAIVYSGNPQREVQLRLFNDAEFSGASVDSGTTTWTLPGGVGMGTVLQDVQRANGRPFSIEVFAGGATSSDWQGGSFGSGGCNYFTNFRHGDKTIKTPYKVLSDDPAVLALGLKVERFGLNCSNC